MPHDLMAKLEADGPYTVDDRGRMLWTSVEHALTYAQVRAMVHRTRQRVVPVTHCGVLTFHVRKAKAKVAEPTC